MQGFHEISCYERWFVDIGNGFKKVECRPVKEFENVQENDLIMIGHKTRDACLMAEIKKVTRYSCARECLEKEGLDRVFPKLESIEDGVKLIEDWYGPCELVALTLTECGVLTVRL